jgi:hypothetical protein
VVLPVFWSINITSVQSVDCYGTEFDLILSPELRPCQTTWEKISNLPKSELVANFSTFKIKYCKQTQLELTGAQLKKDEQKTEEVDGKGVSRRVAEAKTAGGERRDG